MQSLQKVADKVSYAQYGQSVIILLYSTIFIQYSSAVTIFSNIKQTNHSQSLNPVLTLFPLLILSNKVLKYLKVSAAGVELSYPYSVLPFCKYHNKESRNQAGTEKVHWASYFFHSRIESMLFVTLQSYFWWIRLRKSLQPC